MIGGEIKIGIVIDQTDVTGAVDETIGEAMRHPDSKFQIHHLEWRGMMNEKGLGRGTAGICRRRVEIGIEEGTGSRREAFRVRGEVREGTEKTRNAESTTNPRIRSGQ